MSSIFLKLLLATICVFASAISYSQPHVIVLGTAQDGGFPHIGCQNECQETFKNPSLRRNVVSLAFVDPESKKWWLFEATPDLDDQLQLLQDLTGGEYEYLPDGIFITHAHMGHYVGLASLGKEALGADSVKVYAYPKFADFLTTNGPWSQLVNLRNIIIQPINKDTETLLGATSSVRSFTVPHRDEFSETVGFSIYTTSKSYLFIPDIDKWINWDKDIVKEVKNVDYAFLDATFFEDGELPNRAMSDVPHPFVSETMELFSEENASVKSKVHFIHFNHTNPLLFDERKRESIKKQGFNLAVQGAFYK